MLHSVQPAPLIPPLATAVARFLARSRFAARTRESYAQDLAPLLERVGDRPVSAALTHTGGAAYLATQDHLSAGTYNRRYVALRSLVRWRQTQGYLEDDPLCGLERRPQVLGMTFKRRTSDTLRSLGRPHAPTPPRHRPDPQRQGHLRWPSGHDRAAGRDATSAAAWRRSARGSAGSGCECLSSPGPRCRRG